MNQIKKMNYLTKTSIGQFVTLGYNHLTWAKVYLPWKQPAAPAAFTLWAEFANTHLAGGITRPRVDCGDTGVSLNDLNP